MSGEGVYWYELSECSSILPGGLVEPMVGTTCGTVGPLLDV